VYLYIDVSSTMNVPKTIPWQQTKLN